MSPGARTSRCATTSARRSSRSGSGSRASRCRPPSTRRSICGPPAGGRARAKARNRADAAGSSPRPGATPRLRPHSTGVQLASPVRGMRGPRWHRGPPRRGGMPEKGAVVSAELKAGAGFIDDEIVPIEEARIPILDRGFLRSDVTYDVVAVWQVAFYRLDDHIDRFERSCRELRLKPPYTREEIAGILNDLVAATGLRDAYVNVTCTRGVGGTRDPRTFKSHRFYAYAIPYLWILEQPDEDAGMN